MSQSALKKDQIEAVIFDLGNVLVNVDFKKGLFNHYHQSTEYHKPINLVNLLDDELFVQFNTGKLNPVQFYKHLQNKFHFNINYPHFTKLWCDIFDPIAGIDEIFKQISQKYRVGLLSDTDPLHWNFCLRSFPLLQTIPHPTLSFEIGSMKPSPVCYIKAAANIGLPAENCLFIDDKIINVRGAIACGMQAIHCINTEQLRLALQDLIIIDTKMNKQFPANIL